jgi:hypothetical protein
MSYDLIFGEQFYRNLLINNPLQDIYHFYFYFLSVSFYLSGTYMIFGPYYATADSDLQYANAYFKKCLVVLSR